VDKIFNRYTQAKYKYMEEKTDYENDIQKSFTKFKEEEKRKRKISWNEVVVELQQKGIYNEFKTIQFWN